MSRSGRANRNTDTPNHFLIVICLSCSWQNDSAVWTFWNDQMSAAEGILPICCPQVARWKPEEILTAREIRQVTPVVLDRFSPPRDPGTLPRLTREFTHVYMWIGCPWAHVVPQIDAPGV